METVMNEKGIRTIEQVRQFLEGTADVEFEINTKAKRYEWIEETCVRFRYLELGKPDKGLLLKFLRKVSGYSDIQVKRFVRQYFETGRVRLRKLPSLRSSVRPWKISENFLIPVLENLIEQFPTTLLGFHSDNGSEFINRNVAALLNKLLIEMTKSRPRHSNDNALAESKNGSIVRKHLGYTHIPQRHAPLINRFHGPSALAADDGICFPVAKARA